MGAGGNDDLAPRGKTRRAFDTPLATVQGLAYLLIEAHQGTAICDDLRRIDAAAIRLAKVSDNLEHLYRARLQGAQDESRPACSTAPHAAAGLAAILDGPGARSGLILVIDDEEINRELLMRRLTYHGHVVSQRIRGRAARARARRSDPARRAHAGIAATTCCRGSSGRDLCEIPCS